jgi:hypothetical protein
MLEPTYNLLITNHTYYCADELKRMSLESLDGKKKKGGLSGVSFRMGK